MNIVFLGSAKFAVASLRALLTTKHKVSCVVTQPDRKKGRGLNLEPTPVKAQAQELDPSLIGMGKVYPLGLGLRVYQAGDINTSECLKFLKGLHPDLFVVIAYGQILSQEILDIPQILSLNIHASLLPKYRGAAPINWAVINGDTVTGITIIKMTQKMDAGPIILQKSTDIREEDTIITLEEKLSKIAAESLVEFLEAVENNRYELMSQDESRVSFAPKLKKEDGLINWDKPAREIFNLIRGCLSWPGAFTYYKGRLLKIYKSSVCPFVRSSVCPLSGEIIRVSKEGIVVACGRDSLIIEELQMEGKRRMKAEEFIIGHKISAGERLGYPAPF